MKTIRPLVAVSLQGLEDKARALLEGKFAVPTAGTATGTFTPSLANMNRPEDWLQLEGREHGNALRYSYPTQLVYMHKLPLTQDAAQVLKRLNMYDELLRRAGTSTSGQQNPLDATTENDGTRYLGYMQHKEALMVNLALRFGTLNLRQALDLRLDMDEALAGRKKLLDENGREIDPARLKVLHNEIWEVRDPWRAEWLDAQFDEVSGKMRISYDHKLTNGQLIPQRVEPLETALTSDGYMELTSANRQGLATKKSGKKDLYFWPPSNGSVARFSAVSGRASLDCDGGPRSSNSALGVRPTRAKI